MEVLNVNNFNYNIDVECVEFNSELVADYTHRYTTIVLAGPGSPVPITRTSHNYHDHSFDVKFTVSKNDYEANKTNTAKLLEIFEKYVNENQLNKYSITETSKYRTNNKAECEEMNF